MKVGFLSLTDPADKTARSGIIYKSYESLTAMAEAHWVRIAKPQNLPVKIFTKGVYELGRLKKKNYSLELTSFMSHQYAKHTDMDTLKKMDILFAPMAAPFVANLPTDKKIVYLSDATFHSLHGYYDVYSNFMDFNIRQANEIERKTLGKSDQIITTSEWAKKSMVNDYGVPPEKISILEFGANVYQKDLQFERKPSDKLRILFLGVEWDRKGGNLAIDTINALNEKLGIPAVLRIVGVATPERFHNNPYIEMVGFLNKNKPEDYQKLMYNLQQSDILLLPTQAETAGIAFSEASAFGLPIFTHNTGGIGNYVLDGVNGYKLELGSTGTDFAESIAALLASGKIPQFQEQARELYRTRLNWERWSEGFKKIFAAYTL
ncbi:glycosyltransferase family 4 protein [Pollutibacter soli]|uniref:glycosyltransferase family 4 protein n=1 Tax=Pollutibacter soli TaxID=3034157 RepID=UPI003014178D